MNAPPAWRRDRRRVPVLAAVLLLHAAGLLQWLAQAPDRTAPREPPRVAVRLLPRAVVPPAAAAPAPATAARPKSRPAVAPRAARAPAPAGEPPPGTRAPDDTRAAAPTVPASAGEPAPVLESEATARAIRDSARRPGLAAQAGRVGAAERAPDQLLGEGIAQGARGDCLKGEYLGGGMGVLSLPFLAAAALRDQCRR